MKKSLIAFAPGLAATMMIAAPTATTVIPRPAHACSLIANYEHGLDAAHADDTTPPTTVTASAEVVRIHSHDDGGCGGAHDSCGSYGYVAVIVAATDDRAASDQIGYQVRLVGGAAPQDMTIPAEAQRPADPGRLVFYFDVAAAIDMELEVRAVDLNGNLGPPSIVVVNNSGD
jgi:hypothetical protein